MKRFAATALCLTLLTAAVRGQAAADSASLAALGAKLDSYITAISNESIKVQEAETDFLIGSCDDSLIRQFVAERIYRHYLESRYMGVEAVAVHVFDKWFADGKLAMSDSDNLWKARLHADMNRQTLLGCTFPGSRLICQDGSSIRIPAALEKTSVIFFYDTECPKCRVESIMIRNVLEACDYPVDLYAIYIGDDEQEWQEFIPSFRPETTRGDVRHLWLRDRTYERSLSYGLMTTPRLFLVDRYGTVLGRGLDGISLGTLLKMTVSSSELEYGSTESAKSLDRVLGGLSMVDQVNSVSDQVLSRALSDKDTTRFRQIAGDLLYYLAAKHKEPFISSGSHLCRKYILGTEGIWTSRDDSLKVTGLAEMLSYLYSKASPGSKVPDITLSGTLTVKGMQEPWKRNLRKLKGRTTYLIFHTAGCRTCQAALERAADISSGSKAVIQVLDIDMDGLFNDNPQMADAAMEAFDLSALPMIIRLDRKGRIAGRYLTPEDIR